MDHQDTETEVWLDALSAALAKPTKAEADFFAARRQQGLGIGLDKAGNLVRAKNRPDLRHLRT